MDTLLMMAGIEWEDDHVIAALPELVAYMRYTRVGFQARRNFMTPKVLEFLEKRVLSLEASLRRIGSKRSAR